MKKLVLLLLICGSVFASGCTAYGAIEEDTYYDGGYYNGGNYYGGKHHSKSYVHPRHRR